MLDPACGTAGFLISSYKHILAANKNDDGSSSLTPDERGRLAGNLKGYDISPDMVRLSLVNMYLHGFTDPHMYEYDTLTSQDRWNEYADVILANPPFMSPKGGIKPHNRFSVNSKRSEVLFVDYMAEHLTPARRAGIIVPEGVIFQSQTAYRRLRKMLVEEYLVAVISLPAGVFNPYSGVKTSILVLDRSLAKQVSTIGFFKVESDGFSLGAQRRSMGRNDLPQTAGDVIEYLRRLRVRESVADFCLTSGLLVAKEDLAANGEYNLAVERYRQPTELAGGRWPVVELGAICTFMTGGTPSSSIAEYYDGGTIPWLVSGDIHGFEIRDCEKRITQKGVDNSNARILPRDSVLIALNGQGKTRGTVALLRMEGATCNQSLVAMTPAEPQRATSEFIFWILRSMYSDLRDLTGDNERSGLTISILKTIRIPLPPREVQEATVSGVQAHQRVIDGARMVVDHYRPALLVDPAWPVVQLKEILREKPRNGYSGKPVERVTKTRVLSLSATTSGRLDLTKIKYLDEELSPDAECRCRMDDIYLQRGNTADLVGTAALFDVNDDGFVYPDLMIRIRADEAKVLTKYLLIALQSPPVRAFMRRNAVGAASSMPKINQGVVERTPIALPPLAIQSEVVAAIDEERHRVDGCRDLIERLNGKIRVTIERLWCSAGADDIAEPGCEA